MKKYLITALIVLSSATSFANMSDNQNVAALELLFNSASSMSVAGDVAKEKSLQKILEPAEEYLGSLFDMYREDGDTELKTMTINCEVKGAKQAMASCMLVMQRHGMGETSVLFDVEVSNGNPVKMLSSTAQVVQGD